MAAKKTPKNEIPELNRVLENFTREKWESDGTSETAFLCAIAWGFPDSKLSEVSARFGWDSEKLEFIANLRREKSLAVAGNDLAKFQAFMGKFETLKSPE